jgi:hypothetical protein
MVYFRVLGEKQEGLHGMYVQALCSGLEEVLEPYRQTLIDLEKSILKAQTAQLSFIQHKVFPYQPVMRNLCGLLHQIQFKKAHGCFILDLIYKASCSGKTGICGGSIHGHRGSTGGVQPPQKKSPPLT